tara:strand:- start:79 stop:1827 length:1749 start_codon:yes stop_codon:yes gene_type:complete
MTNHTSKKPRKVRDIGPHEPTVQDVHTPIFDTFVQQPTQEVEFTKDPEFSVEPGAGHMDPPSKVLTRPSITRFKFSARYEDEGPIARGGMSTINKVFDRNILRYAAMKKVDPQFAQDEKGIQSFLEEAQVTGQLQHPNIVPVHEVGKDEQGQYYFTMKLVEGATLQEYIKSEDFDPSSSAELYKALQIFLKVCDALSFAHQAGVLHRDLKPDNIMLGSHGQIYLMDWGVSLLMGDSSIRADAHSKALKQNGESKKEIESQQGTIAGTIQYMAPEQALGQLEKVSKQSDIFSLGAILYEILTKRPPYCGGDHYELLYKAQNGLYFPPQMVVPEIHLPQGLCNIVGKAMALQPEERYESVSALKDDIERFLQGRQFPNRTFKADTVIIQEGEHGDEAYIIVRGQCEVYTEIDGRKEIFKTLGPGEVFGESAFFSTMARSASVRAIEPTTLKVLKKELLTEEIGLDAWVGLFLKTLVERFREGNNKRLDLKRELNQSQLLNHVFAFYQLHGQKTPEGHNVGKWSMFCQSVGPKTKLNATQLHEYIQTIGILEVDQENDTITLPKAELKRWIQRESTHPNLTSLPS